MNLLYCTSDRIGTPTGGGQVTFHEHKALGELSDSGIDSWSRANLPNQVSVWSDDKIGSYAATKDYALAHFYAGCWTETVKELKRKGTKVTYTAAAHDVAESRKEHEALGIPYDYPHLNDPVLWTQYLEGYKLADVLICPSTHSADVMRNFGCTNRIEVIPHGHAFADSGSRGSNSGKHPFTVGYLGAVGPDKGLRYLLEAWKMLNYQDGSKLILAGRDSTSSFVQSLIAKVFAEVKDPLWIGLKGWVNDLFDFYSSLDVYCQPSVTEGFGIEVLEAMVHGIPVVCSTGVGACDLITRHGCGMRFKPRDVVGLAAMIDYYKKHMNTKQVDHGYAGWKAAADYTWNKVRDQYQQLWRSLL